MGDIVGDQIVKMFAEAKPLQKKTTISTGLKFTDVSSKTVVMGDTKKQAATFDFLFTTSYGENGAKIEVTGTIFYLADKKELDEIEKSWKEKKSFPNEKIALQLNNKALEIGLLQSLALASQLKLPAPIKLPKFIIGAKEEASE